jgi:iron complex outermembrane receptor protein
MTERFIVVLILTAFAAMPAQAQRDAAVRGYVLDGESGDPVSEAYVFLHPKDDPGAGKDLTVGRDGGFLFQDLAYGAYVLSVNRAGYKVQIMEVQLPDGEERDMIVYMQPRAYETAPVVVTGSHIHSRVEPSDELNSVLQGRELDKVLGLTLAATLKNETGMAMRAMGPAPARPVIRGLGGDRVVMSEDGSKTTDLSASSPDHAVTIEPFSVERIEVLRGPIVLTQSPTTFGGIVNVVRHEIPRDDHDNILGSVGIYGESANAGALASAFVELPLSPLMLRAEASGRSTGDMRSPEGTLRNSYSRSLDYSAAASHIHDRGYAGFSLRDYSLSYGVPGGFIGAHPNGVDIELERRQWNFRGMYALDAALLHDISLHLSRAYYRHKEFEANGAIGSEFRIVNYAGELRASHHSVGAVTEGFLGFDFEQRDASVGGFVFTMPSTSLNLAPYIFERLRFGALSVEAAARYTWSQVTPREEKADARIGRIRRRTFDALSLSATVLYEFSDIVHVGANVSRSNRIPTMEELFTEGPHLAAYSYEVGNPDLELERGTGAELFLYHRWERFSFNVNLFHNSLSAFIIPRNTGRINYATFLPVYATAGVEAVISGFETQVEWQVTQPLRLHASVGYTRGSFSDDGAPLPQIPPTTGRVGANLTLGSLRLGIEAVMAARQDRVDRFEEPTAGYAVLNGSAQYSFTGGLQVHNISLAVENMLDAAYRNHLSRVKSILPEAGVNARLTYKLYFDL